MPFEPPLAASLGPTTAAAPTRVAPSRPGGRRPQRPSSAPHRTSPPAAPRHRSPPGRPARRPPAPTQAPHGGAPPRPPRTRLRRARRPGTPRAAAVEHTVGHEAAIAAAEAGACVGDDDADAAAEAGRSGGGGRAGGGEGARRRRSCEGGGRGEVRPAAAAAVARPRAARPRCAAARRPPDIAARAARPRDLGREVREAVDAAAAERARGGSPRQGAGRPVVASLDLPTAVLDSRVPPALAARTAARQRRGGSATARVGGANASMPRWSAPPSAPLLRRRHRPIARGVPCAREADASAACRRPGRRRWRPTLAAAAAAAASRGCRRWRDPSLTIRAAQRPARPPLRAPRSRPQSRGSQPAAAARRGTSPPREAPTAAAALPRRPQSARPWARGGVSPREASLVEPRPLDFLRRADGTAAAASGRASDGVVVGAQAQPAAAGSAGAADVGAAGERGRGVGVRDGIAGERLRKLSRDQRRAHIMKLVSAEMRDERMARKSPKAAMPTVIAPGGLGSFY